MSTSEVRSGVAMPSGATHALASNGRPVAPGGWFSGAKQLSGLAAFARRHPSARTLVVGAGGIPLLDFFSTSPEVWLK